LTVSPEDVNKAERIEVLRSEESIAETQLRILRNVKTKWDYFAEINTLSLLPFKIEAIKDAISNAKRIRGIGLRFITEITKDNIPYCKEIIGTVELRHLAGVKGNFGISDNEYISVSTIRNLSESEPPATTRAGTTIPHAVYSNIKEDIQQHRYIFEVLWNRAIPAKQIIREIEEGTVRYETRIIDGSQEIIKELSRLFTSSKELDTCLTPGGMQYSYNHFFEIEKKLLHKQQFGEYNGIRYITNIERDNASLAKVFLDAGIRVRHVKNLPPMSFGVSDMEIAATIEKMEDGKPIQSLLLSSEPAYVNHFKTIFEELWKNGIDVEDRIKDIEAGADLADIEVIRRSPRARVLYLSLVKSAAREVLLVFPTIGAFIRQEKMGVLQSCEEIAKQHNVHVRILMPTDKSTVQTVQHLRQNYPKFIDIRYIEEAIGTKATILVVDRDHSLVMELRDDSKQTFDEAIGLSTYSNSKAGVLSYVAIFEKLWQQTELYHKVKETNEQLASANKRLEIHQKMQQEFISVAAHELRTPIQPILSMVGIVRSRKGLINNEELDDSLGLICRNAERLKRLAEDILDVTRIESQSLTFTKERLNLNEVIFDAIQNNVWNQIDRDNKVKIIFEPKYEDSNIIYVEAERNRLNQVIVNLISNAIKFTKDGIIVINICQSKDGNHAIVTVKDTGTGIDPEILPRLFDKFASRSFQGTGLGLFISRSIIERHGGKIWAENNPNGIGATFEFSLPLTPHISK
jgi:signal transduction histidine kinase